jgi:hypothetical protein
VRGPQCWDVCNSGLSPLLPDTDGKSALSPGEQGRIHDVLSFVYPQGLRWGWTFVVNFLEACVGSGGGGVTCKDLLSCVCSTGPLSSTAEVLSDVQQRRMYLSRTAELSS